MPYFGRVIENSIIVVGLACFLIKRWEVFPEGLIRKEEWSGVRDRGSARYVVNRSLQN